MNMDAKPAVSVLLCVYNGGPCLAYTLDSILNQSYTHFEFVIVNDGSTDGSQQLLESYAAEDKRIKLINKPNTGLIDSLNIGLQACSNDIVFRHDAEDVSHPDRLRLQLDFLLTNPHVSCVASRTFFVDEKYGIIGFSPLLPIKNLDETVDANQTKIIHGSVAFRKSAVLQVGGYPRVLHAEDYALWRLMRASGMHLHMLPMPLYGYMKVPRGITFSNSFTQLKAVYEVAKEKYMDADIHKSICRINLRNRMLYQFDRAWETPVDVSFLYKLSWTFYFRLLSLYQSLLVMRYARFAKALQPGHQQHTEVKLSTF